MSDKKKLLDWIISEAEKKDEGPPVVQLLMGNQVIEGVIVTNPEFPELYILRGPQQMPTGQAVMASWTFGAEDVTAILALEPIDSKIDTPDDKRGPGGLIL